MSRVEREKGKKRKKMLFFIRQAGTTSDPKNEAFENVGTFVYLPSSHPASMFLFFSIQWL